MSEKTVEFTMTMLIYVFVFYSATDSEWNAMKTGVWWVSEKSGEVL